MNRNSIIGILLIFGLMIGYTVFMSPSKEELAAQKRAQDSVAALRQQSIDTQKVITQQGADLSSKTGDHDSTVQKSDSITAPDLNQELGAFAVSGTGIGQDFVVESDKLKLTLSSKGGRISQVELTGYKTFDGKPLILFGPDSSDFNLAFFTDVRPVNTSSLFFLPAWPDKRFEGKNEIRITGNDSVKFAMRLYAGSSDSVMNPESYIEYVYTIRANEFMVGFAVNFVGMEKYIAMNTKEMNIDWKARLPRMEKSLENEKLNTTIHFRHVDNEVDYLSERKDDQQSINTRIKWVSFKQQFFSTSLIAGDMFQNADMKKTSEPEKELKYLEYMEATLSLPFNPATDKQLAMSFYFGPNKYNIMRKYKLDLEKQIPLGWSFFLMQWINRFAVLPVFNFLEGFDLNYGIIILILTILLKIVLFPIAYKTYLSSAKMRLLKPEVDEIGAKFPKKEDAMKKQQATMALYKKAGVNPMSGCVPMLLQFPILLAMFRFFPASIELRQEAFLWADDLSSYDSVLDLPFNIPFYGDHVSLFTLLMTISTIIYTKINNDMMSTGNQLPGMKTMMYLMPVMFLGFFNSYSSGLSYYYLLANLLTFAQMFMIRRFVNEDKLHAQIQENKKKPVKKSNFQKRLEDMARNQGRK
ncbi:MAG: membrane protein insertase YidC [Bacteroidota bacterium]